MCYVLDRGRSKFNMYNKYNWIDFFISMMFNFRLGYSNEKKTNQQTKPKPQ